MIKKATTKMGSSLDWDDLESDAEAGDWFDRRIMGEVKEALTNE